MAHAAVTTTSAIPGAVLTDHVLTVPLDHADPGGETLELFARVAAAPDGGDRPYLLFLQGGPGSESPRPAPPLTAWVARALRDFRVVLLDQRGTGRSTPYGTRPPDPARDVARLVHHRADAIVQDAERLREHLGADRWSLLGQSFGGFCALHYLTVAPERLREVLFTGGLPPVGRPVDEVYAGTFDAMRLLNARLHRRFPADRDRLAALLERCDAGEVLLPSGAPVTRRLARTIGHGLGMAGGAEAIHHLLELDPASPAFRHDLAAMLPFGARNPIYAVLHESSYADGGATRWSSQRVQPGDLADDGSLLLTGEHLFPWHLEDDPALRPYAEVAAALAEHEWPRLYDADVLAQVDVPCAAVVYADDPYVLRRFSEETAELLPGMRRWLTDEHLHNGLRVAGDAVLDRLIGLVRGTAG